MLVGVPKEIKTKEFRVGLTPTSVRELVHNGHQVLVETGAGDGIGFSDTVYSEAGAGIAGTAAEVFEKSEMIVKVKEPQPQECRMLREDQILFTFLHLAPDLTQTQGLIDSGCIAIAYETVTDRHGRLPLLAPMSEVAGRMSVQVGAHCLEKEQQGKGVLLGGVPGVNPAKVVILGGGVSGMNAARMAMGMSADVTVVDKSLERLNELDTIFDSRLNTVYSTVDAIEAHCLDADLVIG
ncbi:MAG: alanine dehydrogenase, partial [Pseudomonadota bacterium]